MSSELEIHERDIQSALCTRCAECCRVLLKLPRTDTRYRKFLRTIGFTLLPSAANGQEDCCDAVHDVTLDMGHCQHLEPSPSGDRFRCRIYGSPEFPQMCREFNCVSWAKADNKYNPTNRTLVRADALLRKLQSEESLPNDA